MIKLTEEENGSMPEVKRALLHADHPLLRGRRRQEVKVAVRRRWRNNLEMEFFFSKIEVLLKIWKYTAT